MALFTKKPNEFNAPQVIIDMTKRTDIQWRMALQVLLALYNLENETVCSNRHKVTDICKNVRKITQRELTLYWVLQSLDVLHVLGLVGAHSEGFAKITGNGMEVCRVILRAKNKDFYNDVLNVSCPKEHFLNVSADHLFEPEPAYMH